MFYNGRLRSLNSISASYSSELDTIRFSLVAGFMGTTVLHVLTAQTQGRVTHFGKVYLVGCHFPDRSSLSIELSLFLSGAFHPGPVVGRLKHFNLLSNPGTTSHLR